MTQEKKKKIWSTVDTVVLQTHPPQDWKTYLEATEKLQMQMALCYVPLGSAKGPPCPGYASFAGQLPSNN